MNRRNFLRSLLAAPMVVRSGILMPLRGVIMPPAMTLQGVPIMFDLVSVVRRAFVPRFFVECWRADPIMQMLLEESDETV